MNTASLPGMQSSSVRRALVAGALAVLAIGVALLLVRLGTAAKAPRFAEFAVGRDEGGFPVAIAAARDGTVWFTLEAADALGRVRDGKLERVARGNESIEPLGLAVDASGSAWFTDAPKQRIGRAAPDGTVASFPLATPIARLGRLAIAPDGAVWFAEPTLGSVTRLAGGSLTRFAAAAADPSLPVDAVPFAVAVGPDGTVWATLPNADKLMRIAPDGKVATLEVPTRRGGLADIAVAADGTVYFAQIGANKVGRLKDGRFDEFAVPTPSAAITGLAVAPDGAAWFTELRGHKLARLHDGAIKEFTLPRADARPFGVAVDAQGNVWYADLSGWVGKLAAEDARVR